MESLDWTFFVGLALIPLAGLFSAIDSALSTVSVARVEELEREGRMGARRLRRAIESRPQYINLCVLLYTICLVAAAVQVVTFFEDLVDHSIWGIILGVAVMSALAFIVAGVGPRNLGRQHAYSISLATALPMQILGIVLRPIVRILIVLGNALTPGKGFRNGPFTGEIELLEIVDLARERGVVAEDESRMIQSVFELDQTSAREIMTPRTEIVWIESDKTIAQVLRLAVRSGHSRIPVIGDSVDDVVGVAYLRDLVAAATGSSDSYASAEQTLVSSVMKPVYFEPDSKRADNLLAEMQRQRNHLAVLIDEYGGVAGLVSIEDVLEEIVGEIVDEHDATEVAPIEELEDGGYRLSSRLSLAEVSDLFDVEFDEETTEEADTVAGLLAYELGRVPLPGTRVKAAGVVFLAEGGTDRRGRIRVSTVRAYKLEPEPATDEENPHD
ncbi:hemolysin family protein [Dietzia timorensis]|uniref:UPF0053 protein n=1 Tax=Dietzia timorensis TaxID=499555 RepID=A0A173LN97_9ACTN|nr:UPF0053 protein [Dietzia timorensis]